MAVEIEKQVIVSLRSELYEFQTDPFLSTKKRLTSAFGKNN